MYRGNSCSVGALGCSCTAFPRAWQSSSILSLSESAFECASSYVCVYASPREAKSNASCLLNKRRGSLSRLLDHFWRFSVCILSDLLCGSVTILHLTNPKQKHFGADLSRVVLLLFVVHCEIWQKPRLRQRFCSRNQEDAFTTQIKIRFAEVFLGYAFEGTGLLHTWFLGS